MTTRRCRIGDLAVIVGAPVHRENVGRFVDVIREAEPHMNEPTWWVRMRGGPGLRGDGYNNEGRIRDKFLQPIRGQHGQSSCRTDRVVEGRSPAKV